jgi:hypothetical protein
MEVFTIRPENLAKHVHALCRAYSRIFERYTSSFAMRFSQQTFPKQIKLDQKQPKNMQHFNYLGSTITNDARCTRKIKYGIVIAKAAIYKK